MMPQLPPKHTTHAEPPDSGNGKGGEEHAADRAPRRGPLDIADLGTQLLVPPDALQRQRAGWAQAAQEHEQRATQLRQDAGLVQEDARELAALERELDALWRAPSGLLSEEDHQRVKDLSGLITERRQRLRHADEHIADLIARARRHEAAAAVLCVQNEPEQ